MARVLVSLISEQTIPNVLLIKDLEDIDQYLFISTEKMEKTNRPQWIIQGSKIEGKPVRIITVAEDSLNDIEEKLKGLDFNDDDDFFVNLTCGTKIMSIGVYNFFRNKTCEIFYMPIGKNVYRKIFPEVKKKERLINYRVGIDEYLDCYGVETVNRHRLNKLLRPPEYTGKFFEYYVRATHPDLALLESLRAYRTKRNVPVNSIDGLETFIRKVGFESSLPGALTKAEIKYLTGEWFEEYIYTWLKSELNISDEAIVNSIQIKRKDVQHEFDVMFTYNNALYVIECKTSVYDKEQGKIFINDAIYKLAALKKDFGLYVTAYIFTLSRKGDAPGEIKQSFFDRSEFLGITIFDATSLTNTTKKQQIIDRIVK